MKAFLGDLRLTHNRAELIQLAVSLVSLGLLLKRFIGARRRVHEYRALGAGSTTNA